MGWPTFCSAFQTASSVSSSLPVCSDHHTGMVLASPDLLLSSISGNCRPHAQLDAVTAASRPVLCVGWVILECAATVTPSCPAGSWTITAAAGGCDPAPLLLPRCRMLRPWRGCHSPARWGRPRALSSVALPCPAPLGLVSHGCCMLGPVLVAPGSCDSKLGSLGRVRKNRQTNTYSVSLLQ